MKRKLFGFLLGTTLVLALAACGGGDDDNAANEPAGDNGGATAVNAEEVYQGNCASCHGKDLAGAGSFPSLQQVGAKYSQDEIAGIIENGRGAMPKGLIKGDEKDAVAAWLAEKK
ncbi:cytochrome c [Fredinandcohnia sp. QZ13]|uniref:cytochrome c551 n=1 Tax=Fredinandcohnia sp. QZ13 TaxID=3073144 RepID=UPI0028535AF6|nr:cytochrome c [Fredinandcohnia sp. QZ13]MDR4889935.1 cytochrome c [Fredinandcohnia sp. QZ13]